MAKRPRNSLWDSPETKYIGTIQCGLESWDAYDCTHFGERSSTRVSAESDEDAIYKAQVIFADIFGSLMKIRSFNSYACSKAWYRNRRIQAWEKSRFQIRDQVNHISFIYEIRPDLREVYLVTVMTPEYRDDVAIKSGVISFDICPQERTKDEYIISAVVMRDWLKMDCRVVAEGYIDSSELLWEN